LLTIKGTQVSKLQPIINEQARTCTENLICNLSKIHLSPAIKSLLSKGYSFAPSTQKITENSKNQSKLDIDNFCNSISLKLITKQQFPSNGKQENSKLNSNLACTYPPHSLDKQTANVNFHHALGRIQRLSNCKLVKCWTSNNLHQSLAVRNLRQKLQLTNDNLTLKNFSNLSLPERREFFRLKRLCQNKELLITKADKSQQLVLINYPDYISAINKLLSDQSNYIEIAFNQKFLTAAKIIALIKLNTGHGKLLDLKNSNILLQFTKNPSDRNFYGLPKTHKPKEKWSPLPPIRPICPDINTGASTTG
jgi:hypothetical protein